MAEISQKFNFCINFSLLCTRWYIKGHFIQNSLTQCKNPFYYGLIYIKSELLLFQMGANNIFCWSGAYDNCDQVHLLKNSSEAISSIMAKLERQKNPFAIVISLYRFFLPLEVPLHSVVVVNTESQYTQSLIIRNGPIRLRIEIWGKCKKRALGGSDLRNAWKNLRNAEHSDFHS